MDRRELLEAAFQHLGTAIILLTAAGEDRLALSVEEIAQSLDSSRAPPESTAPRGPRPH